MALLERMVREHLYCCLPVDPLGPQTVEVIPPSDYWVTVEGDSYGRWCGEDHSATYEGSSSADGQARYIRVGPRPGVMWQDGSPSPLVSPRSPPGSVEEVPYKEVVHHAPFQFLSVSRENQVLCLPSSGLQGLPSATQLAQQPATQVSLRTKALFVLGTVLVVVVSTLLIARRMQLARLPMYPIVAGQRLHALCAATVAAAWNHSARSALETDAFRVRHQLRSSAGACREYINRMPSVTACQVLAHTALWRPESASDAVFLLMVEKARILALSFLATQRHGAQLWYWVPFDKDVGPLKAALRLDGFDGADRIAVRAFESELAEDSTARGIDIRRIARANGGRRLPAVLDVARYLLLYKYGGLWLDADVVVMRDFAPLQGLDFAYVLQNHRFRNSEVMNNAILGVQCPHSPFMREVLAKVVEGLPETAAERDVYKWGPLLLEALPLGTFHTLPTCFFEPSDMGMGGQFFKLTGKTSKIVRELAEAGSRGGHPPAFAYHWHNRWRMRISEDSAFAKEVKRLSELLEHRLAAERAKGVEEER